MCKNSKNINAFDIYDDLFQFRSIDTQLSSRIRKTTNISLDGQIGIIALPQIYSGDGAFIRMTAMKISGFLLVAQTQLIKNRRWYQNIRGKTYEWRLSHLYLSRDRKLHLASGIYKERKMQKAIYLFKLFHLGLAAIISFFY
jgi:hypothetical protein